MSDASTLDRKGPMWLSIVVLAGAMSLFSRSGDASSAIDASADAIAAAHAAHAHQLAPSHFDEAVQALRLAREAVRDGNHRTALQFATQAAADAQRAHAVAVDTPRSPAAVVAGTQRATAAEAKTLLRREAASTLRRVDFRAAAASP